MKISLHYRPNEARWTLTNLDTQEIHYFERVVIMEGVRAMTEIYYKDTPTRRQDLGHLVMIGTAVGKEGGTAFVYPLEKVKTDAEQSKRS